MWLFDLQENTLNRGDELYMMLYANDSFMWLIVILFIVFIISVAPLMSGEGIKQKRVLIPFFTSLLMLPLLIFISWDHVRVIDHDGVSIVSFAERQEATWQEVDHVVVEPFIRRNPGTTNVPPSRTALFAIHVVEQSGDVYTFDNFGFNNDKMSQALEVRSHVVGKGIPFFVQQPTEDQWSFMIIELENEDVDERKFQQLFTPDPQ
ncbi:hypothetical protein JCM19038_3295 [Geomicrobium sp. JCM 19038]|nr:hypothetical protein JCM19038_3295 [Geomicrobium sp. JCM 19038]